ncbi:MAG: hypothetical protein LBF97_03495 [Elusimicrobiota bacterium]|jgi:hypothetical protein|nr:hypothetical protein [Elusimicrobiota bacterium]
MNSKITKILGYFHASITFIEISMFKYLTPFNQNDNISSIKEMEEIFMKNFFNFNLDKLVLRADTMALYGKDFLAFEEKDKQISINKTIFVTFTKGCSFSCKISRISCPNQI